MSLNEIINNEFPLDEALIYLNHAAVSPWPQRTAKAITQFCEENVRYGATNYPNWLEKEANLREQLRCFINAQSVNDIALLKNTSEALSIVAEGIDWHRGDNIVSSNEEFPSNRIPWLAQAAKGVSFREIDISSDAPEQALIDACDAKTRLLTISSVQYGTGRSLNLELLGSFCRDNNILFCIDAIQSLGVLPFDAQAVKADFVMADAHKWLLGPESIALFYCAESVRDALKLHQFGWHMVEDLGNYDATEWQAANSARRFECGSPNMLGIHALSASLSIFDEVGIDEISRLIIKNTSYLIDKIRIIKNIDILTPTQNGQLAGIISFKINDQDSAQIHHKLMKKKVICANRQGGIRFSPHFYTSTEKIDNSLEILNSII